MSITETPATPKSKKTTRRKHAASAPKAKPPSELAGLTVENCCAGCDVNGCVISGRAYCAHPFKGGLQGPDLSDAAAIGRFNSAKKLLGKAKLNIEKG